MYSEVCEDCGRLNLYCTCDQEQMDKDFKKDEARRKRIMTKMGNRKGT
jgi:hypothetical protein